MPNDVINCVHVGFLRDPCILLFYNIKGQPLSLNYDYYDSNDKNYVSSENYDNNDDNPYKNDEYGGNYAPSICDDPPHKSV